ncbi:MAG: PilZ domain-containing protein [Phycisphaerales bacterium]
MVFFNGEHRPERRKSGSEIHLPPGITEDRRKSQRREVFRVAYPPEAYPIIKNLSAILLDISVKAAKFRLPVCRAESHNLQLGSMIELKILFDDGSKFETSGTIFRKNESPPEVCVYVCMFRKEIPSEIVTKQQQYLLKNFPDFCRQAFKF